MDESFAPFWEEIRSSINAGMREAFDAPPTFKSYYPSTIPRERRESFLGDSPSSGMLVPPEESQESSPADSRQRAEPTIDIELCTGQIARVNGILLT